MDSIVGLDEIVAPQVIDLVDGTEQDWIDDHFESEVELESEMEQMHEQELKNLQVLEWLHDLPADPKKTILTIQNDYRNSINYISHHTESSHYNWVVPDGSLRVPDPISICSILGDRRGRRWIFLFGDWV